MAGSSFLVAGQVALSIGCAIATPEQASEDEAVRLADRALYRAKGLGRNRAECASPEEPAADQASS